jgi:hypothetical protein
LNGNDEVRCLEKELNECDAKTEYRCNSGHCIPRDFFLDLTTDCPNWYDEQQQFLVKIENECEQFALADCEEHSCGLSQYSCGNGKYFTEAVGMQMLYIRQCKNQRNALLIRRLYAFQDGLSKVCWRHMICSFGFSCLYELSNVSNSSCQYKALELKLFITKNTWI